MKVTKQYIPVVPTRDANSLKVEVFYTLGGYNMFTHEPESRGYYLSVSPVDHAEKFESYKAFTGTKLLILSCSRRSVKKEAQAIELAREKEAGLIKHVLQENNLQLAEPIEEVG